MNKIKKLRGRPKKPLARQRKRMNITLHPDVSSAFLSYVKRRDEEITKVTEEAIIYYLKYKRGITIEYKGDHVDIPDFI